MMCMFDGATYFKDQYSDNIDTVLLCGVGRTPIIYLYVSYESMYVMEGKPLSTSTFSRSAFYIAGSA